MNNPLALLIGGLICIVGFIIFDKMMVKRNKRDGTLR